MDDIHPLRGDPEKIRHIAARIVAAFEAAIVDPDLAPVSYADGMLAMLNAAKRIAIETDRQSPTPPGLWRRLFAAQFVGMMDTEAYDTADPLEARRLGEVPAQWWQEIERLLDEDNEG